MGTYSRGNLAGGPGDGPGIGPRLALSDFQVVPDSLLRDIPNGERSIDRDDAASLLDEYLLKLRACEHAVEYVRARLLARFFDIKAHHRLGYANKRDAAREVLGLSSRQAQALARVGRMIESCPAIGMALRLGWIKSSHAELLARVAEPDTQWEWLAAAIGGSVRALRERVKAARQGEAPSSSDDPHTVDGERGVRLLVDVPNTVARCAAECPSARRGRVAARRAR